MPNEITMIIKKLRKLLLFLKFPFVYLHSQIKKRGIRDEGNHFKKSRRNIFKVRI